MRYFIFFFSALCTALPLSAQWSIDVESGAAYNSSNTFRIPGDSGTKVSLANEFDCEPVMFSRFRVGYANNPRESWSVLIAPLYFSGDGQNDHDIAFNGITFPAGSNLHAGYRFNSYRISYRKNYSIDGPFTYGYGVTLKVRDADISLSDGTQYSKSNNLGIVPLINFRANWQLTPRCGFLLEGDALAAPQGRAEDIMAAFTYRLDEKTTARIGYRMLEGGADNDNVYTFALINYALLGMEYNF